MWEWTQNEPARRGRRSLRRGFTNSVGGASVGGCAGLNLGDHVGDDPAAVAANRCAVAADLGLPVNHLIFMKQVHGAQVEIVEGPRSKALEADALVTRMAGLALAVLVADCVPVLLADPQAGVVGVAHVGRSGLLAGVVPAVVSMMRDLGALRLQATVGPSVCGRCYEVPAEMLQAAAAIAPSSAARSWRGTPAIDVATGVVAQLADLDVQLDWRPGCTRESSRLYSHRRSGVTGRFAGVVLQGEAL